MRFAHSLLAIVICALPVAAHAGVITSGHLDLDIDYTDGALSLSWRTYNPMSEGTPANDDDYPIAGNAIRVPLASAYTVPSSASFACLGPAGSTVYRLKQAQDIDQPWLGYNTQDVAPGVFTGDKLQLALTSVVAAPAGGQLVAYTTNALGTPTYLFNTRDGACNRSVFPGGGITAGVHNHAFWAFTAPGTYTLRFVASGTPAAGPGAVTSGDVDVTFQVE